MPKVIAFTLLGWAASLLVATPSMAQSISFLVDPTSGSVALHNQSYSSTPALTGYSLASTNSLNPAGFSGFTAHSVSGWAVLGQSASYLAEGNLNSSSTVRAGSSYSLGNAFATGHSQDLVGSFSVEGAGTPTTAPVIYTNVIQLRVIEIVTNGGLSVQSTAAEIYNGASTGTALKGYTISSPSGSLVAGSLNGFTGHGVSGWQVGSTTTTTASESRPSGTTTLASTQPQVLGSLFSVNHTQDLTFSYTPSTGSAISGPVIYMRQLAGDANFDGVVNAADITIVASHWLSTTSALGDVNYDGVVNSADITIIASNWLNSFTTAGVGTEAPSAALVVPEPSSAALMLVGMLLVGTFHMRRQRAKVSS